MTKDIRVTIIDGWPAVSQAVLVTLRQAILVGVPTFLFHIFIDLGFCNQFVSFVTRYWSK